MYELHFEQQNPINKLEWNACEGLVTYYMHWLILLLHS